LNIACFNNKNKKLKQIKITSIRIVVHVACLAIEFPAHVLCCVFGAVVAIAFGAMFIVVANRTFVVFIAIIISERACTFLAGDELFQLDGAFSILYPSTIKTFCLNKFYYFDIK
jgi:hypothetical protein